MTVLIRIIRRFACLVLPAAMGSVLPSVTQVLIVHAGTLYTSPEAPALHDSSVFAVNGRIVEQLPPTINGNLIDIDCPTCTVTAGFWNVHVHFTETKWNDASSQPAASLQTSLDDMLLSRGFTTVVDLASDPRNTIALRKRIEADVLKGPRIYTAGSPLYPPRPGIPIYLNNLPAAILAQLAQPTTPDEARRDVERNLALGADLTKLFTGSYIGRDVIKPMPLDIATAAVEASHARGKLVFAHPSNLEGAKIAIESGVDVLAHAPDQTAGVDRALLQRMVDRHMAMSPTLKMFSTTVTSKDGYLLPIVNEVRTFHELGGQLLFGTDVGYMTDYTTDEEFRRLAQAGLNPMDILRMITLAPAERFGVSEHTGRIAPGEDADLTVLDADPAKDPLNFARVRCTIRQGRVIWGNCPLAKQIVPKQPLIIKR